MIRNNCTSPSGISRTLILEYWLPILVWIFANYLFSTDAFSSGETSKLLIPILRLFLPGSSDAQLEFWHHVLRKLAHVSEYFFLAVITYRALKYEAGYSVNVVLLSFVFVFSAASLDELHQLLTISRGASPVDVGYDCFGGLLALWLLSTSFILRTPPRRFAPPLLG